MPLSGVTITLTGNGVSATAITDTSGRYNLDAFVLSSVDYTLTALLAGFETTTRTRVRVVPGMQRVPWWDPEARRHITWVLQVRVANGIARLDDQSVSEGLERQMEVHELLRRLR
jgi:hypothetical protein